MSIFSHRVVDRRVPATIRPLGTRRSRQAGTSDRGLPVAQGRRPKGRGSPSVIGLHLHGRPSLMRRFVELLTPAVVVMAAVTAAAGPTIAEPPPGRPGTGSADGYQAPAESTKIPTRPVIERIEPITDRWLRVFVASPAMKRVMQVQVLLPADRSRPRPTLYMLDGRGAPENTSNWIEHGHAVEFFADKNINVVFTTGGPANLYTDWQRRDPVLGTSKWETFLTSELPPLINERFDGNGRNGIQGVSMGGEAALMLTFRTPGLYSVVAAHSGCYTLATDAGQAHARGIVETHGGNPDNMFGTFTDPDWLAHDVMSHAEALRGTAIYLSSGSGIPGEYDVPGQADLPEAITVGGPLEAGAYGCALALANRLEQLQIPATVNLRPTGTHSWPYWVDELSRSWPTIGDTLGVNR